MYKKTQMNDLQTICDIYNKITGRSRTTELHKWEWFTSPYENKSYVIVDKEDNILGHHGILTIKLQNNRELFTAGKTENTIMKKGYGPLYFKNEMKMHKEYIKEYDILITTTAKGVTQKIREKLGYEVFANYVLYFKIIDFRFVAEKLENKILKTFAYILTPFLNILVLKKRINNRYTVEYKKLQENDLVEIENLYKKVSSKIGFSQLREASFLSYRLLKNPYNEYYIQKLYLSDKLCGYIVYSIGNNMLSVEDILFTSLSEEKELFIRLFNYVKEYKIATIVKMTTLNDSFLDKKYNYFFRKVSNKVENDKLMVKNNLPTNVKQDFFIKNFYFTKLMMEGIS